MVRMITNMELDQLKETLENSFQLAKESDDIELMVDLAHCMQLVVNLKKKTVEEMIGEAA